MPFIDMYLREGATKEQLRKMVADVTQAISDNLENTLPRMVRISIYEIQKDYMLDGGESPNTLAPTLKLQLGPGRSNEAVERALVAVTEAVHNTLQVPKDKIRFYVERVPGENFAIGGKPKQFEKKVK